MAYLLLSPSSRSHQIEQSQGLDASYNKILTRIVFHATENTASLVALLTFQLW
jgi:hypothetical protein